VLSANIEAAYDVRQDAGRHTLLF